MTLHAELLSEATLIAAWEKVRANRGAAGCDGQTIEQFSHNLFGRLLTLKHQVERGEYLPEALLEVMIPKSSGGMRRLAIPAVRDRVLQTAWAKVHGPLLEKAFEEPSFAYRTGRSVAMAVARVAWFRDRGYQWVVDADIQTFFDEIDHSLLIEKLRRTLSDHSAIALLEQWLAAVLQREDGSRILLTRGVPQGSPVSPLLANLYLDDFDEALIGEGLCLVRFADDFLILCKERHHAEEALEFSDELLATLKLSIKQEKTRITHFEEGFRFLGVDFVRNLMLPAEPHAAPWLLPDQQQRAQGARGEEIACEPPLPEPQPLSSTRHPIAEFTIASQQNEADENSDYWRIEENRAVEPALRSLHVTHAGLRLLKQGDRVVVADGNEVLASIPLHKLDQIIVQGNQLISTALFAFARDNALQIHFSDYLGRPVGALDTRCHRLAALDRHQYARAGDAPFQLMVARAMVAAKIHNARVLLRHHNRRRAIPEIDNAMERMGQAIERLATTADLNQVRGVEGAAASSYFQAIKQLLDSQWQFPGRRRRPPGDPANLLLSYGYGILFSTLHTVVVQSGLNPWLGVLHASDGRHPALVSDLMEEFRAPIVDAVVVNALLNQLTPADFIWDGGDELPCRMSDATRKQFIQWIQNKLRTQLIHATSGQRIDYQRLLHYQAWHYGQVVKGEELLYRGWHTR